MLEYNPSLLGDFSWGSWRRGSFTRCKKSNMAFFPKHEIQKFFSRHTFYPYQELRLINITVLWLSMNNLIHNKKFFCFRCGLHNAWNGSLDPVPRYGHLRFSKWPPAAILVLNRKSIAAYTIVQPSTPYTYTIPLKLLTPRCPCLEQLWTLSTCTWICRVRSYGGRSQHADQITVCGFTVRRTAKMSEHAKSTIG